MNELFRAAVFALLRFSGLPWLFREALQRYRVTVLVYHALPAARAAAHFLALRRRYNLISLADFLAARSDLTTDTLPRKSLIITLDDGHRSNYELRPLLEEHRIPVTIFLCSGIIGTQRHYWWLHASGPAETQALKRVPDDRRAQALLARGHTDTREYETRQSLSRDEILAMKSMVDFQSHTVFHPILPACSSERARREVVESKHVLERDYGLEICALAYPNGDHSDREVRLLQEAGYRCGLTMNAGFNDSQTDLFRLRRLAVPDDAGINELIVKASGLWALLKARRSNARRSSGPRRHTMLGTTAGSDCHATAGHP